MICLDPLTETIWPMNPLIGLATLLENDPAQQSLSQVMKQILLSIDIVALGASGVTCLQ